MHVSADITVDTVQWSMLLSVNNTTSLMNTARLLSMKVTNRLRWM